GRLGGAEEGFVGGVAEDAEDDEGTQAQEHGGPREGAGGPSADRVGRGRLRRPLEDPTAAAGVGVRRGGGGAARTTGGGAAEVPGRRSRAAWGSERPEPVAVSGLGLAPRRNVRSWGRRSRAGRRGRTAAAPAPVAAGSAAGPRPPWPCTSG